MAGRSSNTTRRSPRSCPWPELEPEPEPSRRGPLDESQPASPRPTEPEGERRPWLGPGLNEVRRRVSEPADDPPPSRVVSHQQGGFEPGDVEDPRRPDRLDLFEEGGESRGVVAVLLDPRGD